MITTSSATRSASGSSWVVSSDARAPVAQVGDDLAHRDAALGVDPGGGLVEEHHVGPAHDGERQRQALLLAPRQPPPRRAGHGAQAHQVEQRLGVLGVVVVVGEQRAGRGAGP